ncbi:hypothetical protein ACQUW5_02255 [Legionella sp. CNM-1927-20]|uniref:hypothetical protein n=1 Tax=Legionella sp. CNM-1927-20 TaxID=3422221 RepID=UPI00403AD3D4
MTYFKQYFNYLAFITLTLMLARAEIIFSNNTEKLAKDTRINNIIINEIQSHLTNIYQVIKQPHEKADLTSINQTLDSLINKIEHFKANEGNQLSQLLADNCNALTQKLESIYHVVNALDRKQNPIHYLPASVLPFQLLSIDSIQQVSVASVSYDFKTIPLEQGDSLVSWKVVHIDFAKQFAEFENKNKEHVVLQLDDKGEQHV